MSVSSKLRIPLLLTSIAAASMLVACGSDDDSSSASNGNGGTTTSTKTLTGTVAASALVPGGTTGDPVIKAGYYAGATVCLDVNGNGKCDGSDPVATTDAKGQFTLTVASNATGQLLADIGTKATNTAAGSAVASHLVLRASAAQVADQGANIVISPMSSEVQRLVEANNSNYATEKANLATRLSGAGCGQRGLVRHGPGRRCARRCRQALGRRAGRDPLRGQRAEQPLTYATTKLDRGDLYPDNLAIAGGDPSLAKLQGISSATLVTPTQTQAPITFAQAQQAAFNVEGIPRYDAVFILMLENRSIGTTTGGTIGIEGSATRRTSPATSTSTPASGTRRPPTTRPATRPSRTTRHWAARTTGASPTTTGGAAASTRPR